MPELAPWQLEAAKDIRWDFELCKFESSHKCAVDPVRISWTRGSSEICWDAVVVVARLRRLIASDPSIHGSKRAELG